MWFSFLRRAVSHYWYLTPVQMAHASYYCTRQATIRQEPQSLSVQQRLVKDYSYPSNDALSCRGAEDRQNNDHGEWLSSNNGVRYQLTVDIQPFYLGKRCASAELDRNLRQPVTWLKRHTSAVVSITYSSFAPPAPIPQARSPWSLQNVKKCKWPANSLIFKISA